MAATVCSNLPDDISTLTKSEVFESAYLGSLVAGLTLLVIIGAIVGVGLVCGLGKKIKGLLGAADADGDGKISLEEVLGYASKQAAPMLGDGGAVNDLIHMATTAKDALDGARDENGKLTGLDALNFAKQMAVEAQPLLDRARDGEIHPNAQKAIGAIDSMLAIASGGQAVLEGLNLDPNMIPTDPSAVTLDDALNFASLLGQKGAVVLEKAQESGMIDADAVKTMAILDSAIRQTTMASKMDNLKATLMELDVVDMSSDPTFGAIPRSKTMGSSHSRHRAPTRSQPATVRNRAATTVQNNTLSTDAYASASGGAGGGGFDPEAVRRSLLQAPNSQPPLTGSAVNLNDARARALNFASTMGQKAQESRDQHPAARAVAGMINKDAIKTMGQKGAAVLEKAQESGNFNKDKTTMRRSQESI